MVHPQCPLSSLWGSLSDPACPLASGTLGSTGSGHSQYAVFFGPVVGSIKAEQKAGVWLGSWFSPLPGLRAGESGGKVPTFRVSGEAGGPQWEGLELGRVWEVVRVRNSVRGKGSLGGLRGQQGD